MGGETVVALVSVIVSGITSSLALWLTFRERRASYRQTLYTKQVEGYAEIIGAANRALAAVYKMVLWIVELPHSDEWLEAEREVSASKMAFRDVRRRLTNNCYVQNQ